VTFLFTDLESSTRLWEPHPESMHEALARHDALVRGAIEGQGVWWSRRPATASTRRSRPPHGRALTYAEALPEALAILDELIVEAH